MSSDLDYHVIIIYLLNMLCKRMFLNIGIKLKLNVSKKFNNSMIN